MDVDDEKTNVQNNVLRMVGLPHYILGLGGELSPYTRQNNVCKQLLLSIEYCLNAFGKAECVSQPLSMSQCSLFISLSVLVLGSKVRGMERIETLLGMFSLEDHIGGEHFIG